MPIVVQVPREEKWFGTEKVDSFFHFTLEDFEFDGDGIDEIRQRPTRAEGAVWGLEGQLPRRPELFPIADWRTVDGTWSSRHDTFSYGGHLIAHVLTGVSAKENIVPVTQATNGLMKRVENAIRPKAAGPHWLVVDVTGYYDGAAEDPRVPSGFRYTLYPGGTRPAAYNGGRDFGRVSQQWLKVGGYTYDQSQIAYVQGLKKEMEDNKWCIECHPHFAALSAYLPPAKSRPLAFLDYWMIVHRGQPLDLQVLLRYINSIGCGKKYTKWAREVAIWGNVLLHNNSLVSDAYNNKDAILYGGATTGAVIEPYQALIVGGGANSPQLDHIFPAARGGPNCFSNAQITSMSFNVQKKDMTRRLIT